MSELGNLQRRCAAQREEIARLKDIVTRGDTPALCLEAVAHLDGEPFPSQAAADVSDLCFVCRTPLPRAEWGALVWIVPGRGAAHQDCWHPPQRMEQRR